VLDRPLVLWANLLFLIIYMYSVIHPQSNKFVTGVMTAPFRV